MSLANITPNIIAVSIGVILGIIFGYLFLPIKKEYADEKGGRKRKILELIETRGAVSQTDIEKYLVASPEEAARDIAELEKREVIRKTYKPGTSGALYESAQVKNPSHKSRLNG